MSTALFPHDEIRDIQDELIKEIAKAVETESNLLAHAPTGLGKTAASIAPALSNALKTKKTVFFLTSMHTQHKIAIDTIRDIKKKHGIKVIGVDIIGKKHMCLQPGVRILGSRDFTEYCKGLREEGKCEFYSNLKNGEALSFEAKTAVSELSDDSPATTDDLLNISEKHKVCPYEVSMLVGKEANIIVADYYYLFHPRIRDTFLIKSGKMIEDSIIIVDEAHNLPSRIRDLASDRLTNISLKRALTEADNYSDQRTYKFLTKLLAILESYGETIDDEEYVLKKDFIDKVSEIDNYDEIMEILFELADNIRKEQKQSYIGVVASFLESWLGTDEGFTRIFSKVQGLKEEILILNYKCLDPSIISKPVIDLASSVIMMSGTLTPTSMYAELLGFNLNVTKEITLNSPFPDENRLSIIIPKTSTKFTKRNEAQYKEMAGYINKIVNAVPGNSAVFFPSFKLRDDVYKFMGDCEKTIFIERQGLNKQEKEELLENYKGYKNVGAVLLGATSGSFGEGIDLPGDFLKCVVIVGLPLQRPDLETKALIDYYDKKFAKGWDYGYLFPAFNRTLQSAGRCIRSGSDRGVIVFLDERYEWPGYKRCFPKSWNLKTTVLFESLINSFFKEKEEK